MNSPYTLLELAQITCWDNPGLKPIDKKNQRLGIVKCGCQTVGPNGAPQNVA
jgi:hypothetical protein